MAEETIFARILKGEIPSDKVYENEHVYAFRDINPAAPVHILIIPRKPIRMIGELAAEDAWLLGEMMLAARHIAQQEGLKDGYRLVINNGEQGGQTVYHLHVHLLGGRVMTWPPG